MEKIRTFIAIDLPAHLLEQINQLQKDLIPFTNLLLKWTKPENIHLTLKFLGDVERCKLDEVYKAIREIAYTEVPFTLFINGFGVFPNLKQPRIVWVGIERCESLNNIVHHIEEKLLSLGFESENRPFNPHLTVGRIKHYCSAKESLYLSDVLDSAKIIKGSFSVTEIILYQSNLKPGGPIYSRLMVGSFSV